MILIWNHLHKGTWFLILIWNHFTSDFTHHWQKAKKKQYISRIRDLYLSKTGEISHCIENINNINITHRIIHIIITTMMTSTMMIILVSCNKLINSIMNNYSALIIIIIIMTHRQLWSVATTLHGVHVPPNSATSVSSWLGFPRRPAVSMSSGDAQDVFASSYQGDDQPLLRRLVPVLGVRVWWHRV